MPSRREALLGLAASTLLLRGGRAMTAADETRARVAGHIEHWDALGIHRTGSDVDHATAQWLADTARSAGATVTLEPFPFRRRTPTAARLTLEDGGPVIEGLPLFDGGETGDSGLRAPLGPGAAEIAVLTVPPYDSLAGAEALLEARGYGESAAIVSVTDERFVAPGLAVLNAEHWNAPFGPPVLQVGSEHGARLAAAQGSTATLEIAFDRTATQALNVRAALPGRRDDAAPIVVITPRSSWWHSTSERGGGIAVWLELIEHFARRPLDRPLLFTANTGHELGHLGMQHFLDRDERLVPEAHLWLHLGANFATSSVPAVRLQASDGDLMDSAADAAMRAGLPIDVRTPVDTAPFGEARDLHAGGGRFVSLLGRNGHFHHPDDRWPATVSVDRADAALRMCVDLLERFGRAAGDDRSVGGPTS